MSRSRAALPRSFFIIDQLQTLGTENVFSGIAAATCCLRQTRARKSLDTHVSSTAASNCLIAAAIKRLERRWVLRVQLAVDTTCGGTCWHGRLAAMARGATKMAGHGLVDAVGFSLSEPVLDLVDVA